MLLVANSILVVVCNSIGGSGGIPPRKCLFFRAPRSTFRVFSETDIWLYSVTLQYTVDILNLQLSTCMVYVYVNTITRSPTCLA